MTAHRAPSGTRTEASHDRVRGLRWRRRAPRDALPPPPAPVLRPAVRVRRGRPRHPLQQRLLRREETMNTKTDVYPVGWLEAWKKGRLKSEWRHVVYWARRRNWRAVRNTFNGYLAEHEH